LGFALCWTCRTCRMCITLVMILTKAAPKWVQEINVKLLIRVHLENIKDKSKGGRHPPSCTSQRQQVPILSSWNNRRLFRLFCVISYNILYTFTKNHCSLQPLFVVASHKGSIQCNRERISRILLFPSLTGKAGRLKRVMFTKGSSSYLCFIMDKNSRYCKSCTFFEVNKSQMLDELQNHYLKIPPTKTLSSPSLPSPNDRQWVCACTRFSPAPTDRLISAPIVEIVLQT